MPAQDKATIIKKSKLGIELTKEQCAVLSGLVDISEYADGDVVVPEGAKDDRLRVVLSGARGSEEIDRHRLGALERTHRG